MKSALILVCLAATALAGCTTPEPTYTVLQPDASGNYVIEVAPGGTNTFSVKMAEVPVGATVVWSYVGNAAGEPHNVKSDDGLFESNVTRDAFEFSYTFETAGEYTYHCVPHLAVGMTGTIRVVEPVA